jgi:hypothetical protein
MSRTFVAASSQKLEVASVPVSAVPLTLACWFKPSNVAGVSSKALLSIDDSGAAANAFMLWSNGTDGTCNASSIGTSGGNHGSATATGTSNGVWAHHAGVFTSTSNRLAYLNGVAGTADTATVTPSGLTKTTVGTLWSTLLYAEGDIAEAAVWNVDLAAPEIAALAAGLSPLLIRPSALVAYWPIIGNTSPEIDLIGRRELTVVNAAVAAPHPRVYLPAWQSNRTMLVPPPSTGRMLAVF